MRHDSVMQLHRAQQPLGRDVLEQRLHSVMLRTIAQHFCPALLGRGFVYRQPMNSQAAIRLRLVPVHDHLSLSLRDCPYLPNRTTPVRGFKGICHVLTRCYLIKFPRSAHLLRRNFLRSISCEHLADGSPETDCISFDRCCIQGQRNPPLKGLHVGR